MPKFTDVALGGAPMNIRRVGVVGAGTMGNGIAQVFATKGHDVVLLEVNSGRIDKAKQAIQGSLERIAKKGGLTPEEAQSALDRVTGTTRVADLAGAVLAVEAVVEDVEVKRDVFLSLDSVLPPESVLATNTSSISITELAAVTRRPEPRVATASTVCSPGCCHRWRTVAPRPAVPSPNCQSASAITAGRNVMVSSNSTPTSPRLPGVTTMDAFGSGVEESGRSGCAVSPGAGVRSG